MSGELFPLAAGGFDRRRRSHVDLFGDDLLAGAAAAAGGGGGGTVEKINRTIVTMATTW